MPSPKNLLFILTDDQRFDTIGAINNPAIKTPHLDWLANQGTVFNQAHIPGGTSGAVCMPSRAMLHTGRSLFQLDGAGERIPDNHTLLGEHLLQAGYRTFGTGKWHNGSEAYQRSFSDGAEIFFGGMTDHWNVPVFHYDPAGRYDNQLPRCPTPFTSRSLTWSKADHINAGCHSTDLVGQATIDFIEKQDAATPFLAYASFLAPHDPRTMPQEFLDMYDPEEIELPPNFTGGHPFNTGALHIRDEMLAAFPRTPEETRQHIAEYYAMISHLDAQLGRMLEALKSQKLIDDTIIVFTGDNDLALGQHGLFGKQSLYEHSVRVPLIMAGPDIPKGQTRDTQLYLFDIFPTLCELLDIDIPESVDGKSFHQALAQADFPGRQSLYLAYEAVQRGVKKNSYKLIEYAVPGATRTTQLFDLQQDPWEMRNLARDPGHRERLAEMRQELYRLKDIWQDRQSSWGESFWERYHQEP